MGKKGLHRTKAWLLIVSVLATHFLALPAHAATAQKTSTGQRCTIVGTPKSETIVGTANSDVICGLGGNDKISGLGGSDVIDGGSGVDQILGGAGNDSLLGGSGDDSLKGETGKDIYDGGLGLNTCFVAIGDREDWDYTCSLLPNLDYLFGRISGRVSAMDSMNFDGCSVKLYPQIGLQEPVAEGQIFGGGQFDFNTPKGDFTIRVGEPSVQDNLCAPLEKFRIQTFNGHISIGDSVESLEIIIPKLSRVRVKVTNSKGTAILGAKVSAYVNPFIWSDPSDIPCSLNVVSESSDLCLNAVGSPVTSITDQKGIVTFLAVPGLRLKTFSTAKIGKVLLTSTTVISTISQGSTEVNVVFR